MPANWWEKPLDSLSSEEWEQLCDGCGLCCLNKLEDIDTGDVYFSRVACKLLDLETAKCSDYKNRQKKVKDCLNLRDIPKEDYRWLPPSCSYRLRYENKALPSWHPLLTGDSETVHRCGRSACHLALSEREGYQVDDYLIWRLEDVLGEN